MPDSLVCRSTPGDLAPTRQVKARSIVDTDAFMLRYLTLYPLFSGTVYALAASTKCTLKHNRIPIPGPLIAKVPYSYALHTCRVPSHPICPILSSKLPWLQRPAQYPPVPPFYRYATTFLSPCQGPPKSAQTHSSTVLLSRCSAH